jgi:tetratricopeptide (TPR) repeat protein
VRAVNESYRLIGLGDLAEGRGDLRGAEDYYNQASAGLEDAKGNDAPYALSEALVKLGNVYHKQGGDRDAERVFRQALDLEDDYAKHPGSGALLPLIALQNLYRDQHRLSEINPDFERTLSAQEEDLGVESPSLVSLLNDYASVEQEEGDLERAELLYRRVLEFQERNLSPHDVQLTVALMNYAGVLEALGRKEDATALRARAEAIRTEAMETTSPAAP